jgi:hypothetical protein
MIVILIIFIILIIIVALNKNYFIGSINNEKLIFTNNIIDNTINLNNKIIKYNKLINHELCISIDGKLLMYSKDKGLKLINTVQVNENYKFKLLNISGNNIVIYHPLSNSYIYSNNNDVKIGQLNILKDNNYNKAKFNLIYNSNNLNTLKNNKLSDFGIFSLQHVNSGLYLSNEDELTNIPINTKLIYYNSFKKIGIVNELIKNMTESFNVNKGDNKRILCYLVNNGLIPSSFIPLCNNIENFSSDTQEFDFNIFDPHIKMDYQQLFKSYGKNLYNDNLESIDGNNIIDYLKNYHMSILNKNNDLKSFIDNESINLEKILNMKYDDLELIKLNKDANYYFNTNKTE